MCCQIFSSFSFEPLAKVASSWLLDDFILSLVTFRGAIEQLLTKASKESTVDIEDEMLDVDDWFGELFEFDIEPYALTFSRPRGVTDRDWRVYEVLDEAVRELNEKFRALWA